MTFPVVFDGTKDGSVLEAHIDNIDGYEPIYIGLVDACSFEEAKIIHRNHWGEEHPSITKVHGPLEQIFC